MRHITVTYCSASGQRGWYASAYGEEEARCVDDIRDLLAQVGRSMATPVAVELETETLWVDSSREADAVIEYLDRRGLLDPDAEEGCPYHS